MGPQRIAVYDNFGVFHRAIIRIVRELGDFLCAQRGFRNIVGRGSVNVIFFSPRGAFSNSLTRSRSAQAVVTEHFYLVF